MHAGARRAGAELYLAHGDGRQSGSAVTLSAHGIQIAAQLRRHGLATELGIRHSGGSAVARSARFAPVGRSLQADGDASIRKPDLSTSLRSGQDDTLKLANGG